MRQVLLLADPAAPYGQLHSKAPVDDMQSVPLGQLMQQVSSGLCHLLEVDLAVASDTILIHLQVCVCSMWEYVQSGFGCMSQ